MNDATTAEILQELVRRESRSLLQYVREVPVWVAPADRPTLQKVRALAAAELAAVDAIGTHLQKRRIGLPHLGPFPPEFTDVNDAALHHLLPMLVREQKRAAAEVEADLTRLGDDPALPLVQRLLHLKRQHLPELEGLTARPHTIR
jgi:hypothetical protein